MASFGSFNFDNDYEGMTNITITDRYQVEDSMPETFQYYIKVTASRPTPPSDVAPYATVILYEILENTTVDNISGECAFLFGKNGFSEYMVVGQLVRHDMDYSYAETVRLAYSSAEETDTYSVTRTDFPYSYTNWQVSATDPWMYPFDINIEFSTNMPIFETSEEADDYKNLTGAARIAYLEDHCINYGYIVKETTETYHIYNRYNQGTQSYGTVTENNTTDSKHCVIFRTNVPPALYFESNYRLKLIFEDIIDGKNSDSGWYLDHLDPANYDSGTPSYMNPWYGNMNALLSAGGKMPKDGTYTYGFYLDTNIPIFSNKEDAEDAIASGDFSKAGNYYQIQDGNTLIPPSFGTAEDTTLFGAGSALSPFVSAYVMGGITLASIANVFYTDNQSVIDNIKDGLALFGSMPFESLVSLRFYPFDVTDVVTASPQNYIYFGSYQHTGISVDKVTALPGDKYINAGSVYIAPLFNSYRDFAPWTSLEVYLPYVGWQKINIEEYIGKTVNIRYYVDIFTGSAVAVLVADGVMKDYFTVSNIGMSLPLCGSNLSEYANSALNGLLGTAGGAVGGALSGAMVGSAVPGIGTAAGAAVGGTIGALGGIAKGTFDMSQKGKPKDLAKVKGSYTAGVGNYMPQYVIFRYIVHDLIVPGNLTQLYGRPSSAGGKVSTFSGFLKCDTIKMDTSGMSDNEVAEVLALLNEGIFV